MRLLIILLFFALAGCQQSSTSKSEVKVNKAISKVDAITIAEQFVKKQGYTNLSTNITTDEVVFESGEYASNLEKLLKTRHNLLTIPAYGARQYGDFNKWAVAFVLTNDENNIGRAISMDSLGQNVRIDPSPIRLDWIDEWEKDRLIDSLKRVHPDFTPL